MIDQADTPPLAVLTNYLASKRVLLILDNCEHLIEACAQLVAHMLPQCPHVHVLATSRERLRMAGEVNWRVPSLPQDEAVQLFVARACDVRPDAVFGDRDAAAVADICQRLDGIPLAIELAAARMHALSPGEIAARLVNRFDLLTAQHRGVAPRHQTLRAMIAWSVNLLTEAERDLLVRLSVFAGGFTAEAAEAVFDRAGVNTLDVLSDLVDKSLVMAVMTQGQGAARYRILETIRQYAADALAQNDAINAARDRHLDYFICAAEQAEPWLQTKDRQAWLDRLALELDNVRAALEWCRASNNAEAQLRLASALCWFWNFRGHMTEGRQWLEGALALTESQGDTALRAKALCAACSLSWRQRDFVSARAQIVESVRIWCTFDNRHALAYSLAWQTLTFGSLNEFVAAHAAGEESVCLFRTMDDAWGLALALNFLSNVLRRQGRFDAASVASRESAQASRVCGDVWALSNALNGMGTHYLILDEYVTARDFYEQALVLRKQAGDNLLTAVTLLSLGDVAECLGDYIQAVDYCCQALMLHWESGDLTRALSVVIILSRLAAMAGDTMRATHLFAAAQAFDKDGAAQAFIPRPDMEAALVALGNTIFNAAWARGATMTLDEAVQLALTVQA